MQDISAQVPVALFLHSGPATCNLDTVDTCSFSIVVLEWPNLLLGKRLLSRQLVA
jgi:hypothetical protein